MSWWHDLEGGQVGEQRPPPPNADAPYPNLATVPPKPVPTDAATRTKIANGLIADRGNAQYVASLAPIADPSSRTASPALFGGAIPPPPPVDPDASSASMPGATAPPRPAAAAFAKAPPADAPVAPPSKAPRTAVSSAPLPAPAGPAAAPPVIPDAPPPAPDLPGVAIPVTAPTVPPKAPSVPATVRQATDADRVPVAFTPGSAVLPQDAVGPLKALLATAAKGQATISVVGYGDATVTTPDVQTAGVNLGMLRAQAIAAVFTGNGVPARRLRVDAQAAGSGGEARLVN